MDELINVLSECDIVIKFRTDDCDNILNIFDMNQRDLELGEFNYVVLYLDSFFDFNLFVDNCDGLYRQFEFMPGNFKYLKKYELTEDFINKAMALRTMGMSTQSITQSLIIPNMANKEIHKYEEWISNERHTLPK